MCTFSVLLRIGVRNQRAQLLRLGSTLSRSVIERAVAKAEADVDSAYQYSRTKWVFFVFFIFVYKKKKDIYWKNESISRDDSRVRDLGVMNPTTTPHFSTKAKNAFKTKNAFKKEKAIIIMREEHQILEKYELGRREHFTENFNATKPSFLSFQHCFS